MDSYQGREKEVIILSCVRSNPQKEVGFLSDQRRLNVAVSRARQLFVMVGNSETINSDPFIKSIYEEIKANGKIISAFEFDGTKIDLFDFQI